MMMTRMAVRAPMMLIFASIMSIRVGKQLAFIFAGIIPVLGFCLYLMAKTAMPLFKAVFKKYDRLNNSVQENVQAMRVVKSFVREDYETQKFTAESDDVRKDFLKAEKILALNSPLMQFCISVCRILISYFAAKLIVQSGGTYLNVGSLASMITYSMQILMGLMMLSMVFVMITMASASAKRICEVLDEESDLHNPANPIYDVPNGSVDFDNVSFKYSRRPTAWRSRTSTCIFTPARPSASSAAPALRRRASFSSFRVSMMRRKARSASAASTCATTIWKRFAIRSPWCFRRTSSSPVRSKKTSVGAMRTRRMKTWFASASLHKRDEFIQTFPDKYDTYIEQGGTNVSGGQKQRLCIARALLKKPKILIMDDSTSAVDTKTDALIRQAMREEIPDTTKFIIAQRISSVQDADLILVMENGRIDASGTHEELLQSSDIYREVYDSQNKTGGENHG